MNIPHPVRRACALLRSSMREYRHDETLEREQRQVVRNPPHPRRIQGKKRNVSAETELLRRCSQTACHGHKFKRRQDVAALRLRRSPSVRSQSRNVFNFVFRYATGGILPPGSCFRRFNDEAAPSNAMGLPSRSGCLRERSIICSIRRHSPNHPP